MRLRSESQYLFAHRSDAGVWTMDGDRSIQPADGESLDEVLERCDAAGWDQLTASESSHVYVFNRLTVPEVRRKRRPWSRVSNLVVPVRGWRSLPATGEQPVERRSWTA